MSDTLQDVAQCIRESIRDANFGIKRVHENAEHDPVVGQPYLKILIAQNDKTPWDLSHTDRTDGAFSLTACFPADSGADDAETLLSAVERWFTMGKLLHRGGVTVQIRSASIGGGVTEDGWYKKPITITYNARLRR